MSTAGKVLTVLILLAMVGWLIMLSAVTQLNINWQTRIAKQVDDTSKAQERITELTAKTFDLTTRTRLEQTNKDRDLREIQGRTAAVEGRLSIKNEDLARAQIQLADYQTAGKRAELNAATRLAERVKTRQTLDAKLVEISEKQNENARLRDQLARLQTDFKRLLAENAKRIVRDNEDRPSPRPASDRRPAPSS